MNESKKEKLKKLHSYIEKKQHEKFLWGQNDCCTFTSNCIKEICGLDIRKEFKYYSKKGAIEIIKSYGGLYNFMIYLSNKYDIQCIGYDISKAEIGDIIYQENNEDFASISFCLGKWIISPGTYGLDIIRLKALKNPYIWRLPYLWD